MFKGGGFAFRDRTCNALLGDARRLRHHGGVLGVCDRAGSFRKAYIFPMVNPMKLFCCVSAHCGFGPCR
ncbi:hypothetical protein CSPAE12_07830 [Colletotrichum incanum]|nr:hypothetical protein CSPAE12_07830 [Colletotrichum incanum]